MRENIIGHIQDLEEIKRIFDLASFYHTKGWCDELDCSESWARQKTDKTYEEIFELAKINNWYATCIYRNNLLDDIYYEFCINTMSNPDYFIWIQVKPENIKNVLGDIV